MGKAEERGRFRCAGLREESLIWFEGVPVVVGDKPMAAGFFVWILPFTAKNRPFTSLVAERFIPPVSQTEKHNHPARFHFRRTHQRR